MKTIENGRIVEITLTSPRASDFTTILQDVGVVVKCPECGIFSLMRPGTTNFCGHYAFVESAVKIRRNS